MFVYSQLNFIGNVIVGIDGNSFSGTFILTVIFYILAAVLTCVSACLNNFVPWKKKEELAVEGENDEQK